MWKTRRKYENEREFFVPFGKGGKSLHLLMFPNLSVWFARLGVRKVEFFPLFWEIVYLHCCYSFLDSIWTDVEVGTELKFELFRCFGDWIFF